jgi:serine/threonine-protein kinase RsbW
VSVSVFGSITTLLPAAPGSAARARRIATTFARNAGGSPAQLEAIRLAVSEAVTNAVVHGYRGADGEISLTLRIEDGELWVQVADAGCGALAPPLRPGLGWGLTLIAVSSDRFAIAERSDGGTELRMRFGLADPSQP